MATTQTTNGYRKYSAATMAEALTESRGLISPAARKLGASRDTVKRYIRQYSTVAAACEDARESTTDMAEAALYKAIQQGESWAVCFYLKCQAKDRGYVERAEQSGPGGGPIPYAQTQKGTLGADIREIDDHISELDTEIAAIEEAEAGAQEGGAPAGGDQG